MGAPLQAEDKPNSGAYLAARVAEIRKRLRRRRHWYDKALQSDAANPALLDGAILADIGIGDFGQGHNGREKAQDAQR